MLTGDSIYTVGLVLFHAYISSGDSRQAMAYIAKTSCIDLSTAMSPDEQLSPPARAVAFTPLLTLSSVPIVQLHTVHLLSLHCAQSIIPDHDGQWKV